MLTFKHKGSKMRTLLISAAFAATVTLLGVETASAASTEVGRLDCDVSSSVGVIIGGQQEASCVFVPADGGARVDYKGKITEFGLDIGEISKAKLTWLVFSPSFRGHASLNGTYTGVSADAALGLGAGAKVLVGGVDGTISLQPISVEADEGLNLAVGISSFTLRETK
jgi:hypothetical protein